MKPDEPIAQKNIITRGLPKTGQTISYQAGDDGDHEAGWWKGRLNANNRTRFLIRTLAGDDVIFDRATGLMWARDGDAAGCNNGATITWANAITYCDGLDFADFTDWRLPNRLELESLFNPSVVAPMIHPEFTNTQTDLSYWSSTTRLTITTDAWRLFYGNGQVQWTDKDTLFYLRSVRLGV